jgi:uncharacterized surface protein with fasciclin (FAS1) repeats
MSRNSQVFANNPSLFETIARDEKFSTFSRLLKTSGAGDIFRGDGDYTVFAPTNEAFERVSDAFMNALLDEPGQLTLKAWLSYHILPGIFTAANLGDLTTTRTLAGAAVSLSNVDRFRVNGCGLQARDVQASDGILHAIDTVLSPPLAAAM